MNAKDRTEEVLKSIHVLFSKAELIEGSKKKVIIDKDRMLNLLKDLNDCIYSMMEEYELTENSKEKAIRKVQQRSDDIIFDARKEAQDIYAASFMYTDHALDRIQELITKNEEELSKITEEALEKMQAKRQELKDNQIELKTQLENLIESQKYLKLIENENIRLQKEKDEAIAAQDNSVWFEEPEKKIVPQIRINPDFIKDVPKAESEETEEEQIIKLDFSEVLEEEEEESAPRGFFKRRKKA